MKSSTENASDENIETAAGTSPFSRRDVATRFFGVGLGVSAIAVLGPLLFAGEGALTRSLEAGAALAALVAGAIYWLWRAVECTTLHRSHSDNASAVAASRHTETSNRLAAILADLQEGVVVCNLRHQILLHNRAALELLQTHQLQLSSAEPGQALISLMLVDPVRHTLERLIRQAGFEESARDGDAGRFIGGTPDGSLLISGRMSLVLHDGHLKGAGPVVNNRTVTGYVLTFTDATRELAALGQRDALLRATTEDLRSPLANLRAVMETLESCPDLEAEQIHRFEQAMRNECDTLTQHLEQIAEQYRTTLTGNWPMSDLRSLTLIELVRHRVSVHRGVTIVLGGIPCCLHGDSFSLVVLLDHLIARIGDKAGVTSFELAGEPAARWIYLDLYWAGTAISSATIDNWKADPLPAVLGGLTVGDVLRHHRSDLWSENRGEERARLRLPLPPAQRGNEQTHRPAIFLADCNFSAQHQPLGDEPSLARPLDELNYVVFSIETTGPNATGGDEIVAFSAVRVSGRRLLINETFLGLVNPGRPIPAAATARHGISDLQVQDQPGIASVLPRFKAFVGTDVLVAHHAGPALAFLRARNQDCGLSFENPVLDTMLLSLKLQGSESDFSLDRVASLLGISAIDRHTALGDRLITAAILIAQLDVLRSHGIITLGDALCESNAFIDTLVRERLL